MKEPYIEGLAPHDDPESCAAGREAAAALRAAIDAGEAGEAESEAGQGVGERELWARLRALP